MFILIKDNKTIKSYILNKDISYKGINIYESNGKYYINLANNLYFSDNQKHKLLELKAYEILSNDKYYAINIYVYDNDKGYDDYQLYKNNNLIIAGDNRASINCLDIYLKKYYLVIKDGIINSNFDISFNGSQYNNEHLNNNDVIEYLGLRIIYFEDYLYINQFNVVINLLPYKFNEEIIKYPILNNNIHYYLPDDIKQLEIDEIKEYIPIKRNNNDFIKSIMPNIVMCLSMSVMAYINYLSNPNQNELSKLSYIIMPISMLATGLLFPFIFLIIDNHKYKKEDAEKIKEYLEYLNNYQIDLDKRIKEYVDSNNSHYFKLIKASERLFYANRKSLDYMKLSIGKIVISKDIDFKYSNNKQIDEVLSNIKKRLDNIEDYPLFLNIKENRITTLVSKKNDKLYTFHKTLLELAFKHHYDDLAIAIYSKDNSIFDKIYNLPHLFVNNSRLTLVNERQINELEQLKINKNVILLLYDKIEYNFTNENIYVIYFSEDISDLYKDSDVVIEYLNNNGYLYKDGIQSFTYIKEEVNFDIYYDYLGKLRSIKNTNNIYKISNIYDFNIINNYLNCDNRLNAYFAYSNNELLNFDLHESKQGPHGLIGGSTGSGKSELIISLLLSLCIRYSPTYLNIVLIDYKGGGIKESLTYNNVTIPHIVASISNLENNVLKRLIICLNNECKKRQELFKKLSKYTAVSIMNLDDYLSNGYEKYHLRQLAHLLIVVDEFAELKKENPEQIKELISLSRIGRSLGLHLILATQKPGGVIDEEIWSNSKFKIALKVFEEKDSQDIIKSKNAAYLNNPGEFLLSVGNSLIKGQSIYCKNDINNKDPYKVTLLDNTLSNIASYKLHNGSITSEASIYCKNIIEASNKLNLKPYILDFEAPISKRRQDLNIESSLIFGEIDDYINGYRDLLTYDIDTNLLIYSSRKKELNNILNILNENKRQSIVISNINYEGAYISDCLDYDNKEDIDFLFNYLQNNHNLNITILIEDTNCFLSYSDTYLDRLSKLIKRSNIIGINFILLVSNTQISFKLINSFKDKLLIGTNDKTDLTSFFTSRTDYVGNSFFLKDELKCFIPLEIEEYKQEKCLVSKLISHIPNIIKPMIKEDLFLLGYEINSRKEIYCDNNIMVFSLDENLIDIYKQAYPQLEVHLYKYNQKADNKDILWLGSGIFNQRLFISNLVNDIDDSCGIYIKKNKKYLIRSLNYV